jgi:flavin reductase (DIM6/NTAB) family NADH-FMN oxidoreductase RutF
MKQEMGPMLALYPMPVTLVGSMVNGRPNYCPVAHVGILNYGKPQYISVGMHRSHHTNQGIRENNEFSVNMPSAALIKATDHLGLVSGRNEDKSEVFKTVFGSLKAAPLIEECPVSMECRLHQTLELGSHEIFIGDMVLTHADPKVLTDGAIDIRKLDPLLFDMGSKSYWTIGGPIGKAWNSGRQYQPR